MDAPLRLPATLTDGVIALDSHTLADAEAHVAGEDREMRVRFDAPDPDASAAVEHVRDVLRDWIAARAAGAPNFVYAIRRPSGELIGGCEIRRLAAGGANLSYWIYPAFRRQGYAVRALALLCEAASHVPDLTRLEAHIDDDNLASRRTAQAVGFSEAGVVEEEAWNGRVSTRRLFARAPGA